MPGWASMAFSPRISPKSTSASAGANNFMRSNKAEALLEALPYFQQFRGRTVVVKYGGAAMENPDLVESVLRDIVFLEAVGINPVVVHGGGKAITAAMKEENLPARFVEGLRVT